MVVSRSALLALIAFTSVAHAADCPRKDTLGTSRVLTVDAQTTPSRRPEKLSAIAAAG